MNFMTGGTEINFSRQSSSEISVFLGSRNYCCALYMATEEKRWQEKKSWEKLDIENKTKGLWDNVREFHTADSSKQSLGDLFSSPVSQLCRGTGLSLTFLPPCVTK